MSEHNFEVESGKSIKLLTKNKVCTEDIVISAYGGSGIPEGYIKPEGSMDIDENGAFDVTEKAEVNVQVVAKPEKPYIDSSKMKNFSAMFASGNADLSLVENLDTSNGTNFASMFAGCTGLTGEIGLDTSNGTNFASMFAGCRKLQKITKLDTSSATNLNSIFANTVALSDIPTINTDKCTNLGGAFNQNWGNLTVITLTDTSKNTNWTHTFGKCSNLKTITSVLTFADKALLSGVFFECGELQNVTFDYIGISDNLLSFAKSSKLTVDSLLSILNALSDNTELDTTYTVTLGSANLAKLTDEQKEIAYSKNIALA